MKRHAPPPSAARTRPAAARARLALPLLWALSVAGCAPVAALQPPGMTTAVAPGAAGAAHHLGAVTDAADSLVVLVFGDNRPGYRLQSSFAYRWVADFRPLSPRSWLPALAGVPVMLIQSIVPTLDGPQDLVAAFTRRPNGGAEAQVLEAITRALPADLVINTGDLVFQGNRARLWRDFERKFGTPDGPEESLRARSLYLAAPGNHEHLHTPEGRANWGAVLGAPPAPERFWFSVDAGGGLARFVFLDTNVLANVHGVYPGETAEALSNAQLEWLDTALDTDARHVFVVLHHPLALIGHHGDDWAAPASAARRDRLLELCAQHRVTAVFAGHEHLYHRVRAGAPDGSGYWLITTGGGGSPLHAVDAETLESEMRRDLPAGLQLDEATMHTEVTHHFLRLVIPAAGDPRLDVYAVDRGGNAEWMERLELSAE